ncbi:MAG TPA: signal peptidase I [Acidimicrobiales bacterium]|nr:signal peptidase I [Acidimicrobiales bacterium]
MRRTRDRDARQAPVPPPAAKEEAPRRSALGELLVLLAIAAVIALVLRALVAQAFSIPSTSMAPQLAVGDRVVVSKLAYRLHEPRRGDIVVFECPPAAGCQLPEEEPLPARAFHGLLEAVGLRQPSTEDYIKRVVAMAGERVEGREGAVYVDGRRLIEPYLPPSTTTADFGPVTVPPGQLFVMGDNRVNSSDSRVFGAIDDETVIGRATLRVWPPTRAAFL